MSELRRIGWIGCGVMGRWMCQHLLNAGYPASIYSRTHSKCQPLIDCGAKFVNSPQEAAATSDILFLIVGHPHDVEDVIVGERGALKGMKNGGIIVDMTTSRPELARELSMRANECGVAMLDAPVSGGDVGAKQAKLSIMCGGDFLAYQSVLPLFRLMGTPIFVGTAGMGQHTKMTNQILIASSMIGVVEALLYAKKANLNLEKTLEAVSGGAAGSWTLSNLAPRILKRDFKPGFLVEHFIKDIEIALAEAKQMDLSLPGLALVHQLYIALRAQGHEKDGTHALSLALEKLNGI